jgi:hypothetical protein
VISECDRSPNDHPAAITTALDPFRSDTQLAFDAWRKGREDLGEELADVAIYLLSLVEMTGIDLQDEIDAKMAKNGARVYQRLPNGVLAKSNSDAD